MLVPNLRTGALHLLHQVCILAPLQRLRQLPHLLISVLLDNWVQVIGVKLHFPGEKPIGSVLRPLHDVPVQVVPVFLRHCGDLLQVSLHHGVVLRLNLLAFVVVLHGPKGLFCLVLLG